jgi:hypothetical protein
MDGQTLLAQTLGQTLHIRRAGIDTRRASGAGWHRGCAGGAGGVDGVRGVAGVAR